MRSLMLVPFVALAACAQSPAETARAEQAAQAAQIGLNKALSSLTPGATSSCMPINYQESHIEAYGPTILYRIGRGLVYRTDTLTLPPVRRIGAEDSYFAGLREGWSSRMRQTFRDLPLPEWL